MSSKFALSVIGSGLIIQGLLFYAFAGPLTDQSFPGAGDEARHVGVIMRESLAGVSILAGLVIFLMRQENHKVIARILFSCGIGFGLISLIMIKTLIAKAAVIPLPALAIYLAITAHAFHMAFRKN
jgi:hypothetical protein